MTFIHPDRQNIILNVLLFGLIGLVTVSVIWLILLYNKTVSLTHGAEAMRASAGQIESSNSELKGQIFALFDPDKVATFAAAHGLVASAHPDYSPIISEWLAASPR